MLLLSRGLLLLGWIYLGVQGFAVAPHTKVVAGLGQRTASSRILMSGNDDDGDPFYFEAEPKERDVVIPAVTLLCIAGLFGTYAVATLDLIGKGEFYWPHL